MMSKKDHIYSWLGIGLCLFMIVFEKKLMTHANPYDSIFYGIMIMLLSVNHLWHWMREKLHKPE